MALLRKALVDEGLRKIEVWTARHGVAVADWPAEPVDPFLNVNTPEDAERAMRIALQHSVGETHRILTALAPVPYLV